jgi:cyclophilin family peptidyl-prolyl cis-trans isomerase/HEAT repeat protein
MSRFVFRSCWYLLILLLLFSACGEGGSESQTAQLNATDAVQQQIFNVRDRRDARGLLSYLDYDDPNYRYAATMAFASMPDSTALDKLAQRLKDGNPKVREAAALALGQSRSKAAVGHLLETFQAIKDDSANEFHALLLEAVGKCGDRRHLFQLATVPNFNHDKPMLLLGQARAIYQFALRDSLLAEGTLRMVELAVSPDVAPQVRFVAACYLALNKPINLEREEYLGGLLEATQYEADPKIRMFLVTALAKTKKNKAVEYLKTLYEKESDHRVRANVVSGFRYYDYDSIKQTVLKALNDGYANVQMSAADLLYEKGLDKDIDLYRQYAEGSGNWRVRARLYAAAIRHTNPYRAQTRQMLGGAAANRFKSTNNTYEKVALLGALAEYGYFYDFIRKAVFPADSTAPRPEPPVLSAGLDALGKILYAADFNATFGAYAPAVRQEIAQTLVAGIRTGDVGAITVASEILAKPNSGLRPLFSDLNFLVEARGKLSLPRDIEAYHALQLALDRLNEVPPTPPKKNLPAEGEVVDWPTLSRLPPNATAFVETNKGLIAFRLFPNEAPATVANFVRLTNSGFFTNLVFHRVENNFVVQTGCPRGDGYGGIDKGLRTEISPLRYDDAGWVGMASAGPDTEGSQWFITHRPAPHLDGRYTIFGKVEQGIDIVYKLEVGDRILRVEIR